MNLGGEVFVALAGTMVLELEEALESTDAGGIGVFAECEEYREGSMRIGESTMLSVERDAEIESEGTQGG